MPTLAHKHRIRTAAIGKKGGHEAAMLMESELVVTAKTIKRPVEDIPASPITVASTLDFNVTPMMTPLPGALESIKPLPGAWMVVGKGGRPLKDSLMYDAPSPKKKKKNRNRARKPASCDDESGWLADLGESPSTSTCELKLHRSTTRRQKKVGQEKEIRFWSAYRKEKVAKALARDTLIHALAKDGMLAQDDATEPNPLSMLPPLPKPLPVRHDKGKTPGAKLRRRARFASAAARCYSPEEAQDEWEAMPAYDGSRSMPSGGSFIGESAAKERAAAERAAAAADEQSVSSSERWSLDADVDRDGSKAKMQPLMQSTSWAVPSSWAWTRVSSRKAKRESKDCSVA